MLFRSARDDAERATALRLSGRAHMLAARGAEAANTLNAALALDKQLGASAAIGLDLIYLGDNETHRAAHAAASDYYQRALSVYAAAGNTTGAAAAKARLAGAAK